MVACDKDGPRNDVTAKSFGGNHGDDGGHVLYGDGSVRWVKTADWSSNVWGVADLTKLAGY